MAPAPSPVMSSPARRIVPAVGSIRRSTSLPTVDLPQPDSPTRHRVSPGAMAKLTPSTARTCASAAPNSFRLSKKYFLRLSTSRIGAGAGALMRPRPLIFRSSMIFSENRYPLFGIMLEHALGLVAGDHVAGADRAQLRRLGAAALERIAAARRERAADDRLAQRRHDAGNFREAPLARRAAKARDRGHQAARIGMRR